jgi:DNA-binding response OmpR family regulator
MEQQRRVLVVWDDITAVDRVAADLSTAGYEVRTTTDSLDGLILAEKWSPSLIVLNWDQPLVMGAIFRAALATGTETIPPVIALTTDQHTAEAACGGVAAVLSKPPDKAQLVHWVAQLLSLVVGMLPLGMVLVQG